MTSPRRVAATLAAWFAVSLLTAPATSAGLLVTANDDSYTVRHDTTLSVAASGVLANDSGLAPAAAKTSNPAHGTVSMNADGSFTYQPTAGYVGSDSFTYEARVLNLGLLVTDPATVFLTVTNDSTPVAVNDSYTATSGVTLTVAAPGVLANDSDADGDALTAILVDGGGSGSLSLQSNGRFTFTSGGSFTGVRTFTYRASDGNRTSSVATVSITVSAPGATPTPTPTPAPTPTPTPTPAPTPTPTPPPVLPTLPPILPTLPPILPTLPPILPTRPPILPTPPPILPTLRPVTPTPTPLPTRTATPAPGAGSSPSPSTRPPDPTDGSPSPTAVLPPPSGGPTNAPAGGLSTPGGRGGRSGGLVDVGVSTDALGQLGLLAWSVPGFAMAVPGILLILVIAAQAAGGLVWLPIVRRKIGGFGPAEAAPGGHGRRDEGPRSPARR